MEGENAAFKDSRFAHMRKDHRFRLLGNKERKVKIDNRFKGMFSDKKFKMKYQVDKRGRPVNITSSENLKKYYELSSSESGTSEDEDDAEKESESSENENVKPAKESGTSEDEKDAEKESESLENENENVKAAKPKKELKDSDDSNSISIQTPVSPEKQNEKDRSSDESSESEADSSSDESIVDYSRGVQMMESSSSEEESDDSDEEEETVESFDHNWGEMDKEAKTTEEITHRLALCNMDWDRLKAHDIMVMLNSFKPSGGNIKSVHVYPSEFGMERMKEEQMKGPTELTEKQSDNNTEIETEGSDYQTEKLRQYQLNRLKYYYAVVECDCATTANQIYDQCDGIEYESTGNRIDLRFIPNEMTFDQEAKSVATDVPDTATYKPSAFVTSALQQSTVECTWDETDPNRIALTMRKFNKDDLEEMDLKAYLASDSDAEENAYGSLTTSVANYGEDDGDSDLDDEETQIKKYRNLLKGLGEDKEKVEDNNMEMEISWEPGLRETTEGLVKKQSKEKTSTPWEKYLDKKKEKRKKKRTDKKNEEKTEDTDNKVSISDDDIPSDVDLNDPYFKEELGKSKSETGTTAKTKAKKTSKKKYKKKLTPEEQKEKEEREAELKLLLMDEDDNKQHFNLKQLMEADSKTKKKKKAKYAKTVDPDHIVQDNFELDMVDPRFNVLFENPHYNIDPSAPEFKKTKAMESLINEKIKRSKRKNSKKEKALKTNIGSKTVEAQKRKNSVECDSETIQNKIVKTENSKLSKNAELANLVKNVKTMTKLAKNKKKLK